MVTHAQVVLSAPKESRFKRSRSERNAKVERVCKTKKGMKKRTSVRVNMSLRSMVLSVVRHKLANPSVREKAWFRIGSPFDEAAES